MPLGCYLASNVQSACMSMSVTIRMLVNTSIDALSDGGAMKGLSLKYSGPSSIREYLDLSADLIGSMLIITNASYFFSRSRKALF